jgi:hypothetical protein
MDPLVSYCEMQEAPRTTPQLQLRSTTWDTRKRPTVHAELKEINLNVILCILQSADFNSLSDRR